MNQASFSSRFIYISWLCLILALLLGSAYLALQPVSSLQTQIAFTDLDRSPVEFSQEKLRYIRLLLGLISLSALVLLFAFYLFRDRIRTMIRVFLDDLAEFNAAMSRDLMTSDAMIGHALTYAVLLGIVAVGLVIRLSLMHLPLAFDESYSYVHFSSKPLIDIVSDYHVPNNHIFHNLLAHLSMRLFGDNPVALRLPALLAGVLVIPATFLLGCRLFNRDTALLAAALVAIAPAMVEYSAEARGYSMLNLLFVLLFIVATYLKDRRNIAAWVLFVVISVLGAYTIPTMLYGYCVVTAWLALSVAAGRRRDAFREYVVAAVFTGVLCLVVYSPVFLRTGIGSLVYNASITPRPWSVFLPWLTWSLQTTSECWLSPVTLYSTSLILLGLFVGLIRRHASGWQGFKLLLSVVIGILPLVLIQRAAPEQRILNFLFPLLAIVVAYGLYSLFGFLAARAGAMKAFLWLFAVVLVTAILSAPLPYSPVSLLRSPAQVIAQDQVESFKYCGQSAVADAKPVAEYLAAALGEGDVAMTHIHSGILEPVRYQFLRMGLAPSLIQPFYPNGGVSQLGQHRNIYYLARAFEWNVPQGSERREVFDLPAAELETRYRQPVPVKKYRSTDMYLLEASH